MSLIKEETEVEKDIEWLKEWIEEYEDKIIEELGKESTSNYLTTRLHGGLSALKEVNHRINQLDEPEVLTQEWIDEHRKSYTMEDSVEISDLQNLLVPKQEETNDDLYILKDGGGYMTDFELTGGRVSAFSRESEYGADVVMASKPFMEFIQKQVGGELHNITNPEEQRYNVKFKVKSSFGTVGIFLYKKGDEVLAGDNFRAYYPKEDEYRLTEQEIRGFQNGDVLFEHFAVRVKELEE